MGVPMKPQQFDRAFAAGPLAVPAATPSRYEPKRWSARALLLTVSVIVVPATLALWVWQEAVVQLAPAAPLAVFDVPAPETPTPPELEPAPADTPETTSEAPAPTTPQPPATQPSAPTPLVQAPSQVQLAAPVAPPADPAPPPPPPRAAPAAPSVKPADWQAKVLGRLNAVKAYPGSARARRQQGVVMIRFTLNRAGAVLSAALAQSSGFALLDREALALPRRAAPLPAPPEDVKGERIELIVPVEFHF